MQILKNLPLNLELKEMDDENLLAIKLVKLWEEKSGELIIKFEISVEMKIEDVRALILEIIIDILIHEKNNFGRQEYKTVSELLWVIENYPQFGIYETRIGLQIDNGDVFEEVVIRFEKDILWLGVEGVERTTMDPDSYEREYLNESHDNLFHRLIADREAENQL